MIGYHFYVGQSFSLAMKKRRLKSATTEKQKILTYCI